MISWDPDKYNYYKNYRLCLIGDTIEGYYFVMVVLFGDKCKFSCKLYILGRENRFYLYLRMISGYCEELYLCECRHSREEYWLMEPRDISFSGALLLFLCTQYSNQFQCTFK